MTTILTPPKLCAVGVACALLYMLTASRLLWYRPNGARHRHALSWLASALIAATFCRAGQILLLGDPAGAPELVIAALLCTLAWRVRGNLAALLRRSADV